MKKLHYICAVLSLCLVFTVIAGGCNNAKGDGQSATDASGNLSSTATQAVTNPTQQQTQPEPQTTQSETSFETQPVESLQSSGENSSQDMPDLTGKWTPESGQSIASGNMASLSDIYGSGYAYGGSLDLNSDGTFYIGVGIIKDNSAHKGTYKIADGGVSVEYKNGKSDTFIYISDYNGREAIKAAQGDYYIYFCR